MVNVGNKLADKIISEGQQTVTHFIMHKFPPKFKFHDIDKGQIIKIILNMKPKTTCGFGGISMKVVKSKIMYYWYTH